MDERTLSEASRFFQRYTTLLPPAGNTLPNIPDPDDGWILQAAVIAAADWFITGDKALLALDTVQDMPILDPRMAFLRLRGLAP